MDVEECSRSENNECYKYFRTLPYGEFNRAVGFVEFTICLLITPVVTW